MAKMLMPLFYVGFGGLLGAVFRYLTTLATQGIDDLANQVTEIMKDHPTSLFTWAILNTVAWRVLNRGDTTLSFDVFDVNLELFPTNARAFREAAGAAVRGRDSTRSLGLIERSVALDPEQPRWALDLLQELRERR